MKRLTAVLLLLLSAVSVQAQDAGAERERIRGEREAAQARFAERQKACRAKFAVNDCIEKARREHAAIEADLRRQELVLNDADRRRRSEERRRELDERNSPEAKQKAAERRAEAASEQKEREQRAADKAARRSADEAERAQRAPRAKTGGGAPGPQGQPRPARAASGPTVTPEEAARNRKEYEERIREAEAHKAQVRQRIAQRSKPAASALPMPR